MRETEHDMDLKKMLGKALVARTEEWIDEYERQATDELYEKATRYATERAKQVAAVGGPGDDDYVEDLVQAAFADTYTGQLAWDPSRATLEQQVIQTIKNRSRHDRERAAERRHLSFDIHDDRKRSAVMRAEVEASLAADHEPNHGAIDLAEKALAHLREMAIADRNRAVLKLLDAYDHGAFSKQEVMEHTKMSAKRLRLAKTQLATYVDRLPPEIKKAARIAA
jgi:hypothetical protein